ncbi:Gx transporter family protein [Clostridium botulinum]|uniref:Gx transporter family protein n=1 Tax=Clostridium botulinum TaxID=1491 RepID=UPI000471AFF9|nr:Gx transporter family protein [Clostridium botulinum]MCC5423738.1 Gx transporter family protein [Clostridium botulinum]
MKNKNYNTRKMIFLSLMVGIALIIYIIEAQIPVLFPGIKLGLANVISLVTLIMLGGYESLLVMFLRTLLGSMFAGNMSSFMFSLAGGFLSNIIMIILYYKFKENLSLSSISICGAIFHNIGQLFIAAFVVKDFRIYVYLPVLMISGIITGYFIGLCTKYLNKNLGNVKLFNELKNNEK